LIKRKNSDTQGCGREKGGGRRWVVFYVLWAWPVADAAETTPKKKIYINCVIMGKAREKRAG